MSRPLLATYVVSALPFPARQGASLSGLADPGERSNRCVAGFFADNSSLCCSGAGGDCKYVLVLLIVTFSRQTRRTASADVVLEVIFTRSAGNDVPTLLGIYDTRTATKAAIAGNVCDTDVCLDRSVDVLWSKRARAHARTHARTHACMHARTHAHTLTALPGWV